jgi:dTDP-4-dehydrorhamnose reductase
LILGGDGMLGHRLLQSFAERHEVRVTLRSTLSTYAPYGLFDTGNSYDGIDARSLDALSRVLSDYRPQAVVNCIGIIKQRRAAADAIASLEINALFPHRLLPMCRAVGARMVNMSTDCVFSGERGAYTEDDRPDAADLYGRSKLLGEVGDPGAITLRTSIIGTELGHRSSLIEWFLAQRGAIKGYTRAIYSGFTTHEMARIIEHVLLARPELSGVWHVASAAISKYHLLCKLGRLLDRRDVTIVPDDSFVCDRSLSGERFAAAAGYQAPSWDQMLVELAAAIVARQRSE